MEWRNRNPNRRAREPTDIPSRRQVLGAASATLAAGIAGCTDVERLELTDANGDLAHVVPVSANDADVTANKQGVSDGQLLYEQHPGSRPHHGEFRIAATDGDGATVDSVTIEFNCIADVQG